MLERCSEDLKSKRVWVLVRARPISDSISCIVIEARHHESVAIVTALNCCSYFSPHTSRPAEYKRTKCPQHLLIHALLCSVW